MTANVVALAGLCLTLLITLVGVVWKASSVITLMTAALDELRTSIKRLEEGLAQLAELPLLKQRISQVEVWYKELVDKSDNKIERLETTAITHEMRIASTDRFRARTEDEIKEFREKIASVPDLSSYKGKP